MPRRGWMLYVRGIGLVRVGETVGLVVASWKGICEIWGGLGVCGIDHFDVLGPFGPKLGGSWMVIKYVGIGACGKDVSL